MDAISTQRLSLLCPAFAAKVTKAINDLAAQGVYVRVTQGLRTYAEQDALYAKGRTEPGMKVTNARGGYSQHNFGLAVDCVPGKPNAGIDGPWLPDWDIKSPGFQAMVKAMTDQDLVWGGNWHSLPDYDHFQAATLPATPDARMRSLMAENENRLEVVWSVYG